MDATVGQAAKAARAGAGPATGRQRYYRRFTPLQRVMHSALMLYVYGCLLFSGGVTLAPKLFFLGALIYGVIQQDLIPDSYIEDVIIIVIAARAFIYACPEALLNEYATRAVAFQRRIASLRTNQP